jgi:LysR family transcriptional regulator, hca operon transcriptional activator
MFELRHLRYFIAVAEELNFTRAAVRLNTSQPSLSQQIRQLEEIVGTPLLQRNKHHVKLTPAGQVMLKEAREIFEKIGSAVQKALSAARSNSNELVVGGNPSAHAKVIPKLQRIFESRYPGKRVILHTQPSLEQMENLRKRSLDVGFLYVDVDDPSFVTKTILQEKIIVVLPSSYVIAALKRIPPAALSSLPYISGMRTHSPALCAVIERFCANAGVQLNPVQCADDASGLINLVAANLGFSLLPENIKPILPKNIVCRDLDWSPQPTIELNCVYRKAEISPALQDFITVLDEEFPQRL